MAARLKTVKPAPKPSTVPVPTAVVRDWFPTSVSLPGLPPVALARVFATPQGLYVYGSAPKDQQGSDPLFFSPIDYSKTAAPATGYAARNAGIPIVTEAGTVTLNPLGGCGCAARGLKLWRPSWSRAMISWEDAAK